MKSNYFFYKRFLIFFVVVSQVVTTSMNAQTTRGAYWSGYNASTQSFPLNAAGLSSDILSGTLTPSGNMVPYNDSRTVWENQNTSLTVDPVNTPYLSYTIETQGITSITFDKFVLCGIAYSLKNSQLQLRWSVDSFGSALGEFTSSDSSIGNYQLSSVDLSGQGVIPSGTIEFRVYFYASGGQISTFWARVFNSHTGPYASLDGTPSSYGAYGQNVGIWYTATDEPLSTKSFNEQLFSVYPNPVKDFFEIVNHSNSLAIINVYSISGKRVLKNIEQKQAKVTIDISSLKSGFYIVEITSNLGSVYKKIIKE